MINNTELFPLFEKIVKNQNAVAPTDSSLLNETNSKLESDEDEKIEEEIAKKLKEQESVISNGAHDEIPTYDLKDNCLLKEITKSQGDSPFTEEVQNLIDNDLSTKFLNFMEETIEFDVLITFKRPIEIFGYAIRSANDFPGRDPRKWSVKFNLSKAEGSTETEPHYEVIHQETPAWDDRHQLRDFFLEKSVIADQVTFTFTTDYEGFDENEARLQSEYGLIAIQMSEIIFYSEKIKCKGKPVSCCEKFLKFIGQTEQVQQLQAEDVIKVVNDAITFQSKESLDYEEFMKVKEDENQRVNELNDKTKFYAITYSQNILYYQEESKSLRIRSVHQASKLEEDINQYEENEDFQNKNYDNDKFIENQQQDQAETDNKQTFKRNQCFYEESISKFLSPDEMITTLNLNKNNSTVWLGTNIGNLLCFSSKTLKNIQAINTYENTKVQQILFGNDHCFALLQNYKIIKFKEGEQPNDFNIKYQIKTHKLEQDDLCEQISHQPGENPWTEGPKNLIDHKYHTKFLNFMGIEKEFDVSITFKRPIEIFGYAIRSANDFPGRDPRKWSVKFNLSKVEGSTETEPHYEVIHQETPAWDDRHQLRDFFLEKSVIADQVTFTFTTDYEGFDEYESRKESMYGSIAMQMSEIRFHSEKFEFVKNNEVLNQEKEEQQNNIAFKVSGNKEYLAVCLKKEKIVTNYTQVQSKKTVYQLVIYHLEQTVLNNEQKAENKDQNQDEPITKPTAKPTEKVIGRYNLTLDDQEIKNNHKQFKLIPEWICFSKDNKSIFIRSGLHNIKHLLLEGCELLQEFKNVFDQTKYINKIQQVDDQKMIVMGKGIGQQAVENLKLLNLQNKTSNLILQKDCIYNDFVVTLDGQWIFTLSTCVEGDNQNYFEMYNIVSQKHLFYE